MESWQGVYTNRAHAVIPCFIKVLKRIEIIMAHNDYDMIILL